MDNCNNLFCFTSLKTKVHIVFSNRCMKRCKLLHWCLYLKYKLKPNFIAFIVTQHMGLDHCCNTCINFTCMIWSPSPLCLGLLIKILYAFLIFFV
jgi:hypothetical protein